MSDEKHKLGKDVFIALAAVGWADGNLDAEEADAIVRTAMDEGLSLEDVQEIEKATQSPADIGELDRRGMSKEDKLFVYAVASWMTWLDGEVSEPEVTALAKLGDALKIPEKPREHADAIMREVAHQSEDIRPMRYDLAALRRVIHERLAEARAARSEDAGES
jgi:uncharacterized membrane protein YebE (DUF533 family)